MPGELLAELKRLHEAMTPGEWKAWNNCIALASDDDALLVIDKGMTDENREGIVALRNLLPRIIAALTPGAQIIGVHTASEDHDRPPGSERP